MSNAAKLGFLPGKGTVVLPATGFIPVVLGILHYSKVLGMPVVQNPENH